MALAELIAGAAALFTLLMGLGGLFAPRLAQRIAQIGPLPGYPAAIAEMRASFGGIYVGLAGAVIAAMIPERDIIGATFVAAMAWFGLAIGRAVSMIADRSASTWNWTSLLIEAAIGMMLMAPFIAHMRW